MNTPSSDFRQHLIRISHELHELADVLPICMVPEMERYRTVIDRKLVSRLDPSSPLLVALTGGGSTGKSTLFNALCGGTYSVVRSRAGCTRRVLAAVPESLAQEEGRLDALFEQFQANARPVRLKDPSELEEAGAPLYFPCTGGPQQAVLLDTPDFDTGDLEGFTNRAAAQEILAISDVLVYLFNNQTYNNKANTDFIRNVLREVGTRKIILVYRCSKAYSDEEVRDHSATVLSHLFDGMEAESRRACMGFFRMDEEDEVAAGRAFPRARSLDGDGLRETLTCLDVHRIREDVLRGMSADVLQAVKRFSEEAENECARLQVYHDALRLRASWCGSESLASFPPGELLTRFAQLWEQEQPLFLRGIHAGTRGLAKVSRSFFNLTRRVIGTQDPEKRTQTPPKTNDGRALFRARLNDSCASLQADLASGSFQVETVRDEKDLAAFFEAFERLEKEDGDRFRLFPLGNDGKCRALISVPDSLRPFLDAQEKRSNEAIRLQICEEAEAVMPISAELEGQLLKIVRRTRGEMGFKGKSMEALSALFETLPTVLAVTFVLMTPGTAALGAVPLGAVFGLGDLWALVALPAQVAVDAGTKKGLERLLRPIFQIWYAEKARRLVSILENHLEASVLHRCEELRGHAKETLCKLRSALFALEEEKGEKENE